MPNDLLPKIEQAALEVDGQLMTGIHHENILKQAKKEGKDTSGIDKEQDGLFTVSDGRVINRQQADEEFGITHSHEIPKQEFEGKLFIICSQDGSGLGWAMICQREGYSSILAIKPKDDEDETDKLMSLGSDIIPVVELDDIFKDRKKYKNAYWIWDYNFGYELADQLRDEGFKVFGGQEISYKCEKDRKFGTDLAHEAGLTLPETTEFSDAQAGLDFLLENEDKAFVFKPDEGDGSYTTYVPDAEDDDEANKELQRYLKSQEGDTGTYILQERKKGTEVNIEYYLYNGRPLMAYANFECKRKLDYDEGEMVGCAQDIGFIVPVDCKLALNTVAKLLPFFKGYTGTIDCNIIVSDRDYYFLEFCNRYGYNSSPNLFLNLALKSFPEIMSDWIDGEIKNFKGQFRHGFGASILCYIDHPHKGYPFIIPEKLEKNFYAFDLYKDEDGYCLAGYANEVGIICAHGMDIKSAGVECIKNADKLIYPMHAIRHDLDKEDYNSSPFKRYIAMQAMGMFTKETND